MAKNKKDKVVTSFEVKRAPHCSTCGCPTWTGVDERGRCVVCREREGGDGD